MIQRKELNLRYWDQQRRLLEKNWEVDRCITLGSPRSPPFSDSVSEVDSDVVGSSVGIIELEAGVLVTLFKTVVVSAD